MSARTWYDAAGSSSAMSGPAPASAPGVRIPQRRGPNDVRVKPADPDVISDLLDSFDLISGSSFPSQKATPRNASRPRSPTRYSRTASRQSRRSPTRATPIIPPTFTRTYQDGAQISESPLVLPPPEDAAEPPTIRTARPPSGLSKITASRSASVQSSLRRKLSSPRLMISPAPEREFVRQHSTENSRPHVINGTPDRSPSPSRLNSVWENSASLEDEQTAFGSPYPPSTYKGKAREVYPRSNSMRSAAYDMQRAGAGMRSPPSTSHGLPERLGGEVNGSPIRPVVPSRMPYQDKANNSAAGKSPETRNGVFRPPAIPAGQIVPERRSSLLDSDSPPPIKRTPSIPSRRESPEMQRKNLPPIVNDRVPNRIVVNEESDNDETLKRIKELKAARQQRLSSMKSGSHFSKDEPLRSSTMPAAISDGLSQKTSRQLREATEVEEHRISDESERSKDLYSLDVPPIRAAPSKPFAQSAAHSSLSNRKYAEASGAGSVNGNLGSQTPKHSRQNSWSKRWSPMVFANRDDPARPSFDQTPQSSRGPAAAGTNERLGPGYSPDADIQAFLSSPRLSRRVQIPGERRKVVFSEVGDPKGYPVLVCVGMGLTRYIMAFYDELALSLGLRLITMDRPGIGDSDPYTNGPRMPMSWPDDVLALCEQLRMDKFSLLAHSAGAVYALATALRLPHYLRGKIQLLAPWIPPSQLISTSSVLKNNKAAMPSGSLPRSQRFLRILPSSFLKLSNSSFGFGSRNSSTKPSRSNTPRRSRRPSETAVNGNARTPDMREAPDGNATTTSLFTSDMRSAAPDYPDAAVVGPPSPHLESFRTVPREQHSIAAAINPVQRGAEGISADAKRARQAAYDAALTPTIWALATRNANPSVDLLICLERHRTIGFSYSEVGAKPAVKTLGERPNKTIDLGPTGAEIDGNQWPGMGIVIHHGTKDGRVPLENVRWLSGRMMKCEVRELEGLGHGLMGEASVMGRVLQDIAREWEVNRGWNRSKR